MNIAKNIERGHSVFPEKIALVFEEQSFSYKALNEMANRMANGLKALGISRGDRVALFLPNIPEFVISYLGIQKIGAVAVSINVMFKRDEVKFILDDCTAAAIITTEELREQVPDSELPDLKHIAIASGAGGNTCSASSFSCLSSERINGRGQGNIADAKNIRLETLMANASASATAVDMNPKDPAAILYTSGTTGFPKGATLSHGNVISNMYSTIHSCGMRPQDRLLLYLPLFHCFGQNFILNSGLNACATIILQRRFYLEEVLKTTAKEGITMFFGVPGVFAKLLDMPSTAYDMSSVRYYFSAAALMPVEIVQRWQQQHGLAIHEGYGLTETSPFACYNKNLKNKLGSIGMPIDSVEMKIVDEDGQPVPAGELGQIAVRGPNVMLGYWNRPEATAKAIVNDWFHTGDIGRMDEDGYFYIVDRLKDMINVSGFKVYPSEVERTISQHPAVAEVAVYGVPDRVKSERVFANIRLKSDTLVAKEDMIAFCSDRMATYKVPRTVNFVDSLPKNATGKVLKRRLREEAMTALA